MSKKWLLLLLLIPLLLGLWQFASIREWVQRRPAAATAMEQEAAAWVAQETAPGATLLADEAIGRRAGRTTLTLPDAPPAEQAAWLEETLAESPVDFVAAENTLAWDLIREALWFRLAYQPVAQFNAAGVTRAPLTIYAYRPPQEGLGPRQVLNARVPDRLSVLGYQVAPRVLKAGETAQLLLALQAPQVGRAPERPFEAVVRLISPLDGTAMAEWSAELPQGLDPAAWEPGQVLDQALALPLPDDLPAGAYLLNLSLRDDEGQELWPFSFNNDVNRLDRIPLTWLAVPQDGQAPEQEVLVEFGEGIRLRGLTRGEAAAGADLPVTLFWEVGQPVNEELVVFVHVVDESGQLAAGQDGRPAGGLFPTAAWQPGLTVEDEHVLALPPDLRPGSYALRAGLYDPESGVRVPITAVAGQAATGDAAELGSIVIE